MHSWLSIIFSKLPIGLRRVKVYRLLRVFTHDNAHNIILNDGTSFYGHLDDQGVAKTIIDQEFDYELINAMNIFSHENSIIFDVGANYGLASFSHFSQATKLDSKYFLFEPNKKIVAALHSSNLLNKAMNCSINECIVTEKSHGLSYLNIDKENSGASYVRSDAGDYRVKNVSLDDYLQINDIESVDFMKIDVEGYELNVFKGAENALREGKIGAIIFEADSGHLSRTGASLQNLYDYLALYNYQVFHWRKHDFEQFQWNEFVCSDANTIELKRSQFTLDVLLLDTDVTPLDLKFGTDLLAIHNSKLNDFSYLINV